MNALARRRSDFATIFLTSATPKRAAGLSLMNIAQVVQRSGFILVEKPANLIPGVDTRPRQSPLNFRVSFSISPTGVKAEERSDSFLNLYLNQ
jgi:hypothetical protein